MSKPKICVIGLKGLPAFGGAATVGENIINHLKDQFDFTVLSISSHTSREFTVVNGVRQIIFRSCGKGGFNTFLYYIKCLFHVLFHKYDLIHLHHSESGFITPVLRIRNKVIVTFHGLANFSDPKFSKPLNLFFKFSQHLNIRFANVIISVSKPDIENLKTRFSKKILYIPNGTNLPTKAEEPRKTDCQNYISFAAARIIQIKGLHLLLAALHNIHPPVKLVVAGDHDQIPKYQDELDELGKGLSIKYMGLIKEKSKLFQMIASSRFFVFPSLTEAMSMMLIEVVSNKVPVIASDIPSNKAIFSNNEVLFFKNNDPADLERKLKFALENPSVMKEKADRAYYLLVNNYTWPLISSQYARIYYKLIT